jgi:hypothetical protein
MDLINHYKLGKPLQSNHGLIKSSDAQWVFKIKVIERIGWNKLAGKRAFSTLPGA